MSGPGFGSLSALAQAIRAEGGLLASALDPGAIAQEDAPSGPARLAASGPRAAGHEAEYELLVDLIHEGYLVHYDEGRLVRTPDRDLALLLGDQLYALGLTRLAALGDLHAVDALAEVIAAAARARAEGDPARAAREWERGATAVGWGDQKLAQPR